MRKRQYGVKIIAFMTMAAVILSLMPASMYAADYSDINGHWAETQISSWSEKELVSGYSDGMFRPDNEVTRAEFSVFIYRAFKLPDGEKTSAFWDVPENEWYFKAVSAGTKAGIISGSGSDVFEPNRPITRQEAAALISRLLELDVSGADMTFTDKAAIAEWAAPAVAAVCDAKIFSGYPNGTFGPSKPITRAESIAILDRALDAADVHEQANQVNPAKKYKITFNVNAQDTSGKGTPVAGVAVQLYADQERKNKIGDSFTTDSAGTAALELESASYYYTAALTGYTEQNGSFEVKDEAAAVTIDMGAKKKTGSRFSGGGSSPSSDITEVTVGTGGEAELSAALKNKRIKTINITGEISGNFTASVDGQTINGEGTVFIRNKLTGSLDVTAANTEVKNLIVQGDFRVSGSQNSISGLHVAGNVLANGSDNHLSGIIVAGYYTDEGNGNILGNSSVTSNSPGGDVLLAGGGASVQNTKIKNKLTISGNGNSVTGGSVGSAEVAGSENIIIETGVGGDFKVTGNNNGITDSPAKGSYNDSGQGNTNAYTKIHVELPDVVYLSVGETKRIEPAVYFPSEGCVIEAVSSMDEVVATVTIGNPEDASSENPDEQVPEMPGEQNEKVYAEVYGAASGMTFVYVTVNADGYTSVTKAVKVCVDLPVTGWVAAFEPVFDARVTFYTTDGDVICETGPVTTEQGSFFVVVKDLPTDFRVTAQGGTNAVSGTAFTGVLSADYRNFDPDNDTIFINLGSTIVSACIDEIPGMEPNEAEGNVKRFFELPEWVDLFRELAKFSEDGYFDIEAFLAEAEQNGGVEAYIAQLAKEMSIAGTRPFGTPKMKIAAWLGAKIGGAIADQAIGWGLKKAGIGFEATTESQLAAIQSQLNDIKKDLKAMDDKMLYLHGELSHQINENGYNTRVGQLGGLTSAIRSIMDDMAVLVTMKNASPVLRENFRQTIIRRIENNIINAPYVMHDQLMGVGGQESLLKVWSKVIKGRHKFLSSRDYVPIQEQFEYFNGMQACMALLRVEYYNAMGADASAAGAFEMYRENVAAQSALLKEPVPENMLIDRDQNMMIDEGDYFNHTINGKSYKTKAPSYLKYWEAGDMVSEWNRDSHGGHNNWRIIGKVELERLCTYRGSLAPRVYLENQGWVSPLPMGMYFATGYASHIGDLDYKYKSYNLGSAKTEWFAYDVFDVDNYGWHYQMTEYFIPGQPMWVTWGGSRIYTEGGRDSVYIPRYHFNIVRSMNTDELGKYFW